MGGVGTSDRRAGHHAGSTSSGILFSDIRGFSTLAEQTTARDVADRVGHHLAAMAEVVNEHGGMVDEFQGDAVMTVFGVPVATDDHAERALRCALAMQAR